VRRIDAPSKVTGKLRYAGDMVMPHMLHVQVLRSPRAHARIVSIDTSQAEAMEGVEAVITSADVPGEDGFGVFVNDQPIMARGKVRYVGEAVAAVAAEDVVTARRALEAIKVVYEDLPAVFDPGRGDGRGGADPARHRAGQPRQAYPDPQGRCRQGFASCDLVVEETYRTQAVEHAYLEPEAGLAYVDHDGVVTVHSPSQNITHHRHMLARILALPINKVRMIMSPVGGGFGGKEDMIYQGMLALLAMKTGCPVRLVFTREESIASTAKRHPSRTRTRMGLMRDGRIVASEITMICDGGAYGLSTEGVMRKAAILGPGPYDIPNVKIDTYGIYTNNTPSGAFRTFGAMQSQFATESHLDICAERLGLDPFEIRRINGMRDGAVTHTRQKLGSVSFPRLEGAEKASRWEIGAPVSRGGRRGDLGGEGNREPCTLGARFSNRPQPQAGAQARTRNGGKLVRHRPHRHRRSGRRLGGDRRRRHRQGHHRCHRDRRGHPDRAGPDRRRRARHPPRGRDHRRQRHRAHARGRPRRGHAPDLHDRQCRGACRPRCPRPARPGDRRPLGRGARGDRGALRRDLGTRHQSSHVHGRCRGAGQAARRGVRRLGLLRHRHHRPRSRRWVGASVAGLRLWLPGGRGRGRYRHRRGPGAGHLGGPRHRPRGQSARCRRPDRGRHRAGRRPGADGGLPAGQRTHHDAGLAKYILPTSLDVPRVTSILIEDHDPLGPLGVKGIGEPAMVPTCPAITNAIYDAVGIRITELPATPEKVLTALMEKRAQESARINIAVEAAE
jgi:hypothetical protein